MNKYLDKVAEKKEKKERTVSVGDRALGTAGGILAGGALSAQVVNPLANELLKKQSRKLRGLEENSTTKLDTLKKFIRDEDLAVEFQTSSDELKNLTTKKKGVAPKGLDKRMIDGGRASFREAGHAVLARGGKDGRDLVNTPTISRGGRTLYQTDPVLHELGHSKDFKKFRKAKMYGKMGTGAVGTAGMLYSLTDEDAAKYAPMWAALREAPTLRNEFVANKNAYDALKKYQGKADARKALRKTLAPAFSTYGIGAGAKIGGAALAGYFANMAHAGLRKRREDHEAYLKKVKDKAAKTRAANKAKGEIEKVAKKMTIDPIVEPTKPKNTISSLKQKHGTDSITLLKSTERALEKTKRPRSLRETMNTSARKSYRESVNKGAGTPAANAVKKMQQKASTPRSSSNVTNQKV